MFMIKAKLTYTSKLEQMATFKEGLPSHVVVYTIDEEAKTIHFTRVWFNTTIEWVFRNNEIIAPEDGDQQDILRYVALQEYGARAHIEKVIVETSDNRYYGKEQELIERCKEEVICPLRVRSKGRMYNAIDVYATYYRQQFHSIVQEMNYKGATFVEKDRFLFPHNARLSKPKRVSRTRMR